MDWEGDPLAVGLVEWFVVGFIFHGLFLSFLNFFVRGEVERIHELVLSYKFSSFLLSFLSSFICIILYRIFNEYMRFHLKHLSTNTRSSDHYHYCTTALILSYPEHLRQDCVTDSYHIFPIL